VVFFSLQRGVEKVLNSKFKNIKRKTRPDGKWQMIIFDIPERKRHLRDLLRIKLYFLEYKMFQQSVWISPYDTYKETEKFLRENSLDQYVRLFLIEEINKE
jgi:phenylacetic acid degradation operon negative regulatory protein